MSNFIRVDIFISPELRWRVVEYFSFAVCVSDLNRVSFVHAVRCYTTAERT
jgi:hypothetical protein